jgi:peptidoglycan/xylan/chitin deacetylase (PgdA/CDA1 family)
MSSRLTPDYPRGPFAHALMFHHFHGGAHPRGQGAISAEDFDAMIDFVGARRVLQAAEWQERSSRERLAPDDLCITFDDALRCQIDIALPVLEARGLTAFWFVYSSAVEGVSEGLEVYRYLRTAHFASIEEFYDAFDAELASSAFDAEVKKALAGFTPETYLAEYRFYSRRDRIFRYLRDRVLGEARYFSIMDAMVERSGLDRGALADLLWLKDDDLRHLGAAGHVVGLHSYSHPTLMAAEPVERQRTEYQRNREHILRATGRQPRAVAHPCGSYGPETLGILRDLGVELGFRADMTKGVGAPLERPRADHADVMAVMREGR